MINREKAEEALDFLADTDDAYANAKVNVERCQFFLKRREAIEYLGIEKGSIPERQAMAKEAESVVEAERDLTRAMVDYETIKAQRETKRLVWEHWRSLNSARKAGLM